MSNTLGSALQPFVDSKTLAGAVLLAASRDRILTLEAIGYSDLSAGVRMQADCLFWIASVSKPLTAAACMMLVDEGKLNVQEPVEHYLPEFANQQLVAFQDEACTLLKKPSRAITVRDILSHTSGLPFMSRVESRIDTRPLSEAVLSYALTPLKSEPGTKYDYSNAGTNTAGRIIEVISGMPYERFMQTRLFEPLGMLDTTFFPTADQVRRLAKAYTPNPSRQGLQETTVGQLTYPLTAAGRYACPAGGLFSTAGDLARFGQMILNGGLFGGHRYLSESAVRQMTSTQTGKLLAKDGDENGYGFGYSTTRNDPGQGPAPAGASGHGGAYSNQFWIDPQKNLVSVYMVQHAGFPNNAGALVFQAFQKSIEVFGGSK